MRTRTRRQRPTTVGGWTRYLLSELFGLVGELLVIAGAVLVLFVGWQLWWTDVVTDSANASEVAALEAAITPDGSPASTTWVTPEDAIPGKAFAIVRIPRFGEDYARPLFEGSNDVAAERATLKKGIAHYPDTALPGEVGNFSMAGHRTTYGKPFNRIAELQPGDHVIVETRDTFYVYSVTDHEIVLPSQSEVVAPVPGQPGEKPTEKLLTMTTCHPEFRSTERYIQHGKLEATYPRATGLPADLLEVAA